MRVVLALSLAALIPVPGHSTAPVAGQPAASAGSCPIGSGVRDVPEHASSPVRSPAGAQPHTVVTVAVLRRDGIIVPFAQFDGRRWRNPWPTPLTRTDVPISLASVPEGWFGKDAPGAAWSAWLTDGTRVPVAIRAPNLFPSHCVTSIGLTTDYRAAQPAPPPFVHHQPKDGLAVTGGLVVEPIGVLRADTPEWDSARVLVEPYVEAIEQKGESDWSWSGALTFFNRRARGTTPLAVEVICRAPGPRPGTWYYFFEAVRRYPRPDRRAPAREFIAFSQGFVLPDRPARTAAESGRFAGSIDDPPDFEYFHPLGWFRIGATHYWAVQWSGRGRERYAILEFGEKTVTEVISAAGGGC